MNLEEAKKDLKRKFFNDFLPDFKAVEKIDSDEVALKKILNFLYYFQNEWMSWAGDEFWVKFNHGSTIKITVFRHISDKEQKKRLFKEMLDRGFSGGCDCGCRGDFCITDEGLDFIGRERVLPYGGY